MNGINYHKTLTAWLERFDDSQEIVKHLDYGMDYAKFRRIWRFYLLMLGWVLFLQLAMVSTMAMVNI
jgi:cyclopropane-fatty-acyl-phospholipid synthase